MPREPEIRRGERELGLKRAPNYKEALRRISMSRDADFHTAFFGKILDVDAMSEDETKMMRRVVGLPETAEADEAKAKLVGMLVDKRNASVRQAVLTHNDMVEAYGGAFRAFYRSHPGLVRNVMEGQRGAKLLKRSDRPHPLERLREGLLSSLNKVVLRGGVDVVPARPIEADEIDRILAEFYGVQKINTIQHVMEGVDKRLNRPTGIPPEIRAEVRNHRQLQADSVGVARRAAEFIAHLADGAIDSKRGEQVEDLANAALQATTFSDFSHRIHQVVEKATSRQQDDVRRFLGAHLPSPAKNVTFYDHTLAPVDQDNLAPHHFRYGLSANIGGGYEKLTTQQESAVALYVLGQHAQTGSPKDASPHLQRLIRRVAANHWEDVQAALQLHDERRITEETALRATAALMSMGVAPSEATRRVAEHHERALRGG